MATRSFWRNSLVLVAVAFGVGISSCQGKVGGTSNPDGGTDAGHPLPDGGGGVPDSGATPDSGSTNHPDSGSTTTPDSGTTTTADAGSTPDAGSSQPTDGGTTTTKSAKRGIAYDLADDADMAALSPGVSWWYNWSSSPNSAVPSNYLSQYGMDFIPMLWNGNFNASNIESFLSAHPEVQYLLVLNEPNLTSQSNLTPDQAAQLWPQYEAVAAHSNVKIVGPAITWGTMTNYEDPVAWMDAFYASYQAANNNRDPQIDYIAFHWYDYGLGGQLDRLTKYNKPFWVTEFANWHSQNDGAQIDTLAKQEAQMTDMVSTCESRTDVFRYAWFTGRVNPDPHYDSLLGAPGVLTDLGTLYLSLPAQ
jgi:hypothetical protein